MNFKLEPYRNFHGVLCRDMTSIVSGGVEVGVIYYIASGRDFMTPWQIILNKEELGKFATLNDAEEFLKEYVND